MARNSTAAKKHNASKKTTVVTSAQAWKISGTNNFGSTKEELKARRRELNASEGVHEVDVTIEGQNYLAAPSNSWPYRITKGPGHPHNAA
jgi:hypothetical protein